ncbi:hypothetical protein HZA86_00040 [Candidatus Uhrbacteria bacterium]|nr:hypothetical protein [Candidatus Uhrbacteria bacterium]
MVSEEPLASYSGACGGSSNTRPAAVDLVPERAGDPVLDVIGEGLGQWGNGGGVGLGGVALLPPVRSLASLAMAVSFPSGLCQNPLDPKKLTRR